jgi:hypothetical protein
MSDFIVKLMLALLLCFVSAPCEAAAPSKGSGRMLWEHPGGYVKVGHLWRHKTGGDEYSLVETARNPVFIDLLDPARGERIRLYNDRMLIREGNNSSGPEAIWLSKRATGNWEDVATRNKWSYPDGSLEVKGAAWFEPTAHGVNMFIERAQRGSYRTRGSAARLYDSPFG